jgi:iron-sulfur cluster repair protein YtfE (RIC family)
VLGTGRYLVVSLTAANDQTEDPEHAAMLPKRVYDPCGRSGSHGSEMNRHPALEALSRDHHHALVVAQRLKRADRGGAVDAQAAFLGYWRADGAEHFEEEEQVLLPLLAAFADPSHPVVAKVLTDHVRIRRLAADASADPPDLEVLHRLGSELEQHVRREERELFALIEQAVPDQELRRLGDLLR